MDAKKGITPTKAALAGMLIFFCVAVAIATVAIIRDREEKREHRAYLEHAKAIRTKEAAKAQAIEEAKAATKAAREKHHNRYGREAAEMTEEWVSDAGKIEAGAPLHEVVEALGQPTGSCWSEKEIAQVYVWGASEEHMPLLISFRNYKVLEKPDRKTLESLGSEMAEKSRAVRDGLMLMYLKGSCAGFDATEDFSGGPRSRKAEKLTLGLSIVEVRRVVRAMEIGKCSLPDGSQIHVYDNGPKHTPVQVITTDNAVIGWDEGRFKSEEMRDTIRRFHLSGNCDTETPK